MARKKQQVKSDDLGARFSLTTDWKHNGRLVERGTEISIVKHGRMTFLGHVRNIASGAEWVDCVDKNKQIRSFRPEQIKRIHYKKKMGE